MTEKKAPVKKDDEVSKIDIEAIILSQAESMAKLAASSIPSDTQAILKKMEEEHESPYILSDKVAVLTVSTVDLATIDGWPGYIDEDIPGQFTKQHLQKRLRIPIEIQYNPSLMRSYSIEFMDREEFDKLSVSSPSGTIPTASMVSAISLRAGDNR